jgi:hypothetical protein
MRSYAQQIAPLYKNMNPNDIDLEAAAQAQAEQAQREYEARLESNRKKIAASVALKAADAKRFTLYQIDGQHLTQPKIQSKAQNWNCRIELFRMQDDKPLAYNLLTETAGVDLADGVELVLKKLRSGELHFERRVGY